MTELEPSHSLDDSSTHTNQPPKKPEPCTTVHTKSDEDDISRSRGDVPALPVTDGTGRMAVVQQPETETVREASSPADHSEKRWQHEGMVVPGGPDSSIQFQADWKRLRRDKATLTTYFKVSFTIWFGAFDTCVCMYFSQPVYPPNARWPV